MNEIKLNKGFLVTLHNDLIQARFSGSLSMMEQKILFTVLSNVEPPEHEVVNGKRVIKEPIKELNSFIVPVKEFTRFLEIEDPNYAYFRATTKKLMEKVIYIEQENGDWEMFHWVDYARYKKNEGTIEIKISPHLYPYLLNLDGNFTKTKLDILFSFKSVYSARIYQLVKKWSKLGKWRVELDELKDLIGVPVARVKGGVKEFKLAKYSHFKTRALEVALKEINEYSEFDISITEHKTVRKITALTFNIKKKEKDGQVKQINKEEEPKRSTKEENQIYGHHFLEKYEVSRRTRTFVNKETREEVYFDGRERVTAILTEYAFKELDKDSLQKMEDILTEIIEVEDFDIVKEMYFLFNYTEHAESIEKPNSFIISVLMKIKKEVLKGNKSVKATDFINIRNNNIDMNIPDWQFDYLKSKKEVEAKKEIERELNALEGTNLSLFDVSFLEMIDSLNEERGSQNMDEENQENYKEYLRLKEIGVLEDIVRKKQDELKEKDLWDSRSNSLKKDAVEVLYEQQKKTLVTT